MSAMPRRSFFAAVFGTLAAAVAAVIGIPVTIAFLDPSRRKTVSGGGGPSDFGKLIDLPVGEPRKLDVISERMDAWDRSDAKPVGAVWLVRRDDVHVDAYSAVCPHLGCSVNFRIDGREFACPCHDSAFALADGRRLKGPSPRGLDPLPVEVRNGRVFVTFEQFIPDISERRKA